MRPAILVAMSISVASIRPLLDAMPSGSRAGRTTRTRPQIPRTTTTRSAILRSQVLLTKDSDTTRARAHARASSARYRLRPGAATRRRLLFGLAQPCEHAQVLERGGVADALLAARDVAQESAHDLAAAGLRQRVGEADVVGLGERADLLRDVLAQLVLEPLRGLVVALEGDE